MSHTISVDDFKDKFDSLYRLVIVASRRANMLSKPETRPLVETDSKKPTTIALEEVLAGKVGARLITDEDEELFE